MTNKKKPKIPLNFVDLRKSSSNKHQNVIQDIIPPELKRRWFWSLSLLQKLSRIQLFVSSVLLLAIIVVCLKMFIPSYDPVPQSIRQAVHFQVLYPNPAHLPKGYILDNKSFSTGNNVVLYTVSYGSNQKLIFTEQSKPSTTALEAFNNSAIPLHTTVITNIGTATIGTARGETIVSLPTNGNSWILVTAPFNTPQKQLTQVLEAF